MYGSTHWFLICLFNIIFCASIKQISNVRTESIRGETPRKENPNSGYNKYLKKEPKLQNLEFDSDKNGLISKVRVSKDWKRKKEIEENILSEREEYNVQPEVESRPLGEQGDNNFMIQELHDNGNNQDVITREQEKEIFLFIPDRENVCYYKNMDDDVDDDDDDDEDKEENPADKWKISRVMGRLKRGSAETQRCENHGPHYIDEQLQIPLHSACGQRPVVHIDQLSCQNNPSGFYRSPSMYHKYRGKKCLCKYVSRSEAKKSCCSWTSGWWRLKNRSRICVWTQQFVSQLSCKKDVSTFQSAKKYYTVK